MSNWGISKWRSIDEEISVLNRKLEICITTLESLARETGTPYAEEAQQALNEVEKWKS